MNSLYATVSKLRIVSMSSYEKVNSYQQLIFRLTNCTDGIIEHFFA